MPTSRPLGATLAVFTLGLVAGVLIAVAAFLFVHRDTTVFETNATVRAGAIVIPKGTLLIHDAQIAEGFDRLALYLNVDAVTLERSFIRRVDSRTLLRMPYWVTGAWLDATQTHHTSSAPEMTTLQHRLRRERRRPRVLNSHIAVSSRGPDVSSSFENALPNSCQQQTSRRAAPAAEAARSNST